jgi:hypothetical protein
MTATTTKTTKVIATAMPSVSTLTADDKARIKRAVPASGSTGTNKIITATCARVYRARPGEEEYVNIRASDETDVAQMELHGYAGRACVLRGQSQGWSVVPRGRLDCKPFA